MNYASYNTEELCTFLKLWGTGFKQLDPKKHENAEAYYQACVDAHEFLKGEKMHFYTLAGLRRTMLLIAQDFYVEFTSKRQGESYKHRSELCTYIAENLLKTQTIEGVQQNLFQ
jgi:hypothetical protein